MHMRKAIVAITLLAASVAAAEPTADELSDRAKELTKKLDGQGFTVVVEAPFVVIGDEDAAVVKKHATGFLRRNIGLMEKEYFPQRPDKLIEIWLFKNEKSYRKGAKKFFDDEPDTPYGYYSSEHTAMVMNIGPGAG